MSTGTYQNVSTAIKAFLVDAQEQLSPGFDTVFEGREELTQDEINLIKRAHSACIDLLDPDSELSVAIDEMRYIARALGILDANDRAYAESLRAACPAAHQEILSEVFGERGE